VILARYLPSDHRFGAVEQLFRKQRETRYISEISLLELHCVFSRIIRAGELRTSEHIIDFDTLSAPEKVKVAVEHAIRSWRLRLIESQASSVKLTVAQRTINIRDKLYEAIQLSKLGLKTLDTLHLAYAMSIKELYPDLETFTTFDGDMISKRDEIEKETAIEICVPTGEAK
jgi:predicted nucleic acid-binding protein